MPAPGTTADAIHGPALLSEASVQQVRLLRLLPGWRAEPVSPHLADHSHTHHLLVPRRLIEHLIDSFGVVRDAVIYPCRTGETSCDRILVTQPPISKVP